MPFPGLSTGSGKKKRENERNASHRVHRGLCHIVLFNISMLSFQMSIDHRGPPEGGSCHACCRYFSSAAAPMPPIFVQNAPADGRRTCVQLGRRTPTSPSSYTDRALFCTARRVVGKEKTSFRSRVAHGKAGTRTRAYFAACDSRVNSFLLFPRQHRLVALAMPPLA